MLGTGGGGSTEKKKSGKLDKAFASKIDPCLIGFTGLKLKSVSTISVIIGKLSVCYVQYNIAGQSL